MKQKITISLIASVFLLINGVNAQLSADLNVDKDSLKGHLDQLIEDGNEKANKELDKELESMVKSKDEEIVILAIHVYRQLGQNDEADALESKIVKMFPKGVKARQEAFEKIREEELSTEQFEKKYKKWLKKFPSNQYTEKEQNVYSLANIELAKRYGKEGNVEKAIEYVEALERKEEFIPAVYAAALELNRQEKYEAACSLLSEGHRIIERELLKESPDRVYERYNNPLQALYGVSLVKSGKIREGITYLEEANKERASSESILALAEGYASLGRELDAFLTLEGYLLKVGKGKNEALIEKLSSLYKVLNQDKGDVSAYLKTLDTRIHDAFVLTYKGEMLKEEAPDFELVNRAGKTVRLKDLKGKIVVLDFWATWCGPCVISFPGMQKAVDKYEDDDDIEFLFINTWQKESNYKELVEDFMQENNYRFEVLYDEMKERSKATVTAYGVTGIPTKIFIDKEGFIRFRSIGGSDNVEAIVNEMTIRLDILKEG